MTENIFNHEMDWAFRGKNVEVVGQDVTYRGVCARIHYNRGSVLLYDATIIDQEDGSSLNKVGSVFVRTVNEMRELRGAAHEIREIAFPRVEAIEDSPWHDAEFEPSAEVMRAAYRNKFTGSFPVVRLIDSEYDATLDTFDKMYQLINGHKRIEACRRVGLDRHAVEVIKCTDEQAEELVRLAHDDETE